MSTRFIEETTRTSVGEDSRAILDKIDPVFRSITSTAFVFLCMIKARLFTSSIEIRTIPAVGIEGVKLERVITVSTFRRNARGIGPEIVAVELVVEEIIGPVNPF